MHIMHICIYMYIYIYVYIYIYIYSVYTWPNTGFKSECWAESCWSITKSKNSADNFCVVLCLV